MTRSPLVLASAALALAAGTFAFRLAGPLLRARATLGPRGRARLEAAAVVLLTALAATSALAEGHGFAGLARPAGVLAGAVAAWRKAPFAVVVVIAAAVTALLRLGGVP